MAMAEPIKVNYPTPDPIKEKDAEGDVEHQDTSFRATNESLYLTEEEKLLERKLLRKIDYRWLPLTLIYILNYIDRNAMPAARLKGFQTDTNLTGSQYELSISIFFVGYIIMQIPSNFMLNAVKRPSWYIAFFTGLWGIVSLCGGFVNNFSGVVAVRFILGFVEAPFFPGALFALSKWYTKEELALRQVGIYVAASISSALSGLLAAGILSGMDGKLGHAGWRWLFWLEGSATVLVALLAAVVLPDWPETSRFLTEQERALAIKRLQIETGGTDSDTTPFMTALKKCFLDYRVWLFSLAIYCHNTSFSFTSYFPTIVKTLGYDATKTLLLTSPPWFFSAILIVVVAWLSDRQGSRFWWIIASLAITVPGFIILLCTTSLGPNYLSMFLMLASHAGYILMFSWLSTTLARPPAKRAVAYALTNSIAQLGQITGGYLFPDKWGPHFNPSWAILLSMSVAAMAFYLVIYLVLKRSNAKIAQGYVVTENGFWRRPETDDEITETNVRLFAL